MARRLPRRSSVQFVPAAYHIPSKAELRRKILVVDDEPSILRWLDRSLEYFGYEVLPATNAFVAYDILGSRKIDALILDIRLGGHSGLEVLEYVRSIDVLAQLPVIILTGVPQLTEKEEKTIRRHRAHLFFKPQDVEPIAATLNRLLSSPRP